MVSTSRRSRLKDATDSLHRRIDRHIDEADFFASPGGYGDYVRRTLRARGPLEAILDRSGAGALFAAWPERRIAGALRADLDALGLPEAPAAPCDDEPLCLAGMLGALYVLEGSAIGAHVISRRAAALGIGPASGGCHLHIQKGAPQAFRAFLHVLETARLDAAHENECLRAAVATFECFERAYAC